MKKVFAVCVVGCGSLMVLAVIALAAIGTYAPEASVYTGRQIPKDYLETIRSLDLLDSDEKIQYFYSDGLFGIESGFYFVSDKKLVLYSDTWEEPKAIIPFGDIDTFDATYDDSFFTDSMVFVSTHSGMTYWFPLSSEQRLDRRFVGVIKKYVTIDSNQGLEEIEMGMPISPMPQSEEGQSAD